MTGEALFSKEPRNAFVSRVGMEVQEILCQNLSLEYTINHPLILNPKTVLRPNVCPQLSPLWRSLN